MRALGFTVGPVGQHAFGTENTCVYFSEGSYLEPLAIGDRDAVRTAQFAGNMFVRRDYGYRFRHGDNGFSMLVLSSDDAEIDRERFHRAGYRTGELLTVERPGVLAKSAFAVDERSPDATLFAVERVKGLDKFADKLTKHANGALGLRKAVLCEPAPHDFQVYLMDISGQREEHTDAEGFVLPLANGSVAVTTPAGLADKYGVTVDHPMRGLRIMVAQFAVGNLAKCAALLSNHGVPHQDRDGLIVVPDACGRGTNFAFAEDHL